MEWNETIKRTPKKTKTNGIKIENEQKQKKMRNESEPTWAIPKKWPVQWVINLRLPVEWEMDILLLSY